jgi:hypothetical protein
VKVLAACGFPTLDAQTPNYLLKVNPEVASLGSQQRKEHSLPSGL